MTTVKHRIEARPVTGGPRPAMTVSRGRRTRARRRALWAVAGAALLVLLALSARPDPVEVEAAVVTRGPLETVVQEQGITRVRDRFVITAPIAGRLLRVAPRQGDGVYAGQVVARIVPAPADARVSAQAEQAVVAARAAARAAATGLGEARARHAQASRERRRQDALADAGAVSESVREQALLAETLAARAVEAAVAALDAARAQQRQAEAALIGLDPAAPGAPVEVRAPAAGRVLAVPEASERVVGAGAPLLEIADARVLEVVVEVLSEDAVRLRPGVPVRLTGWGGVEPLSGRVRTVEPGGYTKVSALGVEEQRVRVVADLDAAPPSLGDGYRVEAELITWRAADAVRVPLSALFRQGEAWRAFVVEDGRAVLRQVGVGHLGPEHAEVLSGLRPGERVVDYPASDLRDRARVRAVSR